MWTSAARHRYAIQDDDRYTLRHLDSAHQLQLIARPDPDTRLQPQRSPCLSDWDRIAKQLPARRGVPSWAKMHNSNIASPRSWRPMSWATQG
jgi:hypothetical protein